MKTKKEFVEEHRHALMGYICDAVLTGRKSELLAAWLRNTMSQIDAKLGAMYDQLVPPPTVPPTTPANTNGVHNQRRT